MAVIDGTGRLTVKTRDPVVIGPPPPGVTKAEDVVKDTSNQIVTNTYLTYYNYLSSSQTTPIQSLSLLALPEPLQAILQGVGDIFGTIFAPLGGAVDTLRRIPDALGNIVRDLWERVRPGLVQLGAQVERARRDIANAIQRYFNQFVLSLSGIWTSIVFTIAQALDRQRARLSAVISAALNWALARLNEMAVRLFNEIRTRLMALWQFIEDVAVPLADYYINLTKGVLGESMVNNFMYMPRAVAAPGENPLGLVRELTGRALLLGLTAHGLAAGIEAVPVARAMGLQQVAGYISQFASFQQIANNSYDVYLSEALAWPMRYYIRQLYRPKIPAEGEIFTMGRKHGITREQFGQFMAMQGLSEFWIQTMYDFFWTDPSPFLLRRIAEAGMVDVRVSAVVDKVIGDTGGSEFTGPQRWLYGKHLMAGYEVDDAWTITKAIWHSIADSERTHIKSATRRLLRSGYQEAGRGLDLLRARGLLPEQIQLMLDAEELNYRLDVLDTWDKVFTRRRNDGLMDDGEYRVALTSLGLRGEMIEARAALATAAVEGRPAPKVKVLEDPISKKVRDIRSQATLLMLRQDLNHLTDLFDEGTLAESEFDAGIPQLVLFYTERMESIGHRPDLAAAMVELEVVKLGLGEAA